MSRQRIADAAVIAPYLTHIVSHHGQLTLIPPENAGRIRKAKPKRNRSRPRAERSVRSEEEIRFNTGSPRNVRSQPTSPSRAGRRHGRETRRDDEYNDG